MQLVPKCCVPPFLVTVLGEQCPCFLQVDSKCWMVSGLFNEPSELFVADKLCDLALLC